MIDTIKFLVPIDDVLFLESLKTVFIENKKEDLNTKEIKYAYYSSEVYVGSHSKKIIIRLEEKFYTGLSIEFSIPKYAKGNNIEMIWPRELPAILNTLYTELCFHLGVVLPDVATWSIHRLDLCYNWIFTTKEEAENVMGFLQRIDYPRKKKGTYDTSVMHIGSAYTLKFYLKGSEFKAHDLKDKEFLATHTPERIFELSEWANRILRYEIEFRRKYLEDVFGCKPVYLADICDDEKIQEILSFYLKDKTLKYVTLKNTTEAQVEEILYSNFTKIKATRLFQFFRDYFLEAGAVKSRMVSGGLNRSTIYRYKRDLKRAGVGFDLMDATGASLLEQLVIPSGNSKFELVGFPENVSWRSDNGKVV